MLLVIGRSNPGITPGLPLLYPQKPLPLIKGKGFVKASKMAWPQLLILLFLILKGF